MIINGKEAKLFIVDELHGWREIGTITDFQIEPDAKPVPMPIKDLTVSITFDATDFVRRVKKELKHRRYISWCKWMGKRPGRRTDGL